MKTLHLVFNRVNEKKIYQNTLNCIWWRNIVVLGIKANSERTYQKLSSINKVGLGLSYRRKPQVGVFSLKGLIEKLSN